jgi:broad specificity phosphatase PhoE
VRLFLIARHAHSVLNDERRISGDPSVDVPLTAEGEDQARRLGEQVANVPIDLCVHTRFGRTRATAALALAGRRIALECDPLFDDVDVGDLDGSTVDDYRAWKRRHARKDRFPGGESLDEAARRYAQAYRRLLQRDERTTLVVSHEIPLRYALNGAAGSDELDGPIHALPNAMAYLFDEDALERAVIQIEALSA